MVLTTVKLPLIELWRVNEKQVDYKLTWSVHWTNQKLLYCSVIVLVALPIIQHEELIWLMASEWGYKNRSSNRGKFQWHFDQGKGFSLSLRGIRVVRVNRVKMAEKWGEIHRSTQGRKWDLAGNSNYWDSTITAIMSFNQTPHFFTHSSALSQKQLF